MAINFDKNKQEPLDLGKGSGDDGKTPSVAKKPASSPMPATPAVPALPNRPNVPAKPVISSEPSVNRPPVLPARPAQVPAPALKPREPITQREVPEIQQPIQEEVRVTEKQPEPETYVQPQRHVEQQYDSGQLVSDFAPKRKVGNGSNNQPSESLSDEPQVVMVDRKGRPIKQKPSTSKKGKAKKVSGRGSFAGDRKKVFFARLGVFGIIGVLCIAGVASFVPRQSALSPNDRGTILSWVRGGIGVTAFPTELGRTFAIEFTRTYLNYDISKRTERYNNLSQFLNEDLLKKIDIHGATAIELQKANAALPTTTVDPANNEPSTETPDSDDPVATPTPTPSPSADTNNPDQMPVTPEPLTPTPTATTANPTTTIPNQTSGFPADENGNLIVSQSIINGPYVVQVVDLGAGNQKDDEGNPLGVDALITTISQLDNGQWVYLQVPIHYNYPANQFGAHNPAASNYVPTLGRIVVSGIPTFVAQTTKDSKPGNAATNPGWKADDTLAEQIKESRILPFFQSWLSSDGARLSNFYVNATANVPSSYYPTPLVTDGLDGRFKLIQISSFAIQQIVIDPDLPEADQPSPNDRQAIVGVVLLDPTTGFVYPQEYLLRMVHSDGNWYVQNIQNIAMSITPNVVNLAPNGG